MRENFMGESNQATEATATATTTPTPRTTRQIAIAAILLVAVTAVALFGSLATSPNVDGWYADATKVPWNPPGAVFGPVWSVLYVMIAAAGFLTWRAGYAGKGRSNHAHEALRLFVIQLVLNAAWTPLFFAGYPVVGNLAWWGALVVIIALMVTVVLLMRAVGRHSRIAAWLLLPYLLWLLYASTLNVGIIALN
ncbi:TspO/MBR family protein [Leucobacter sp. GX24907]